jgi:nucleoid-associated protein YgaU
MDLFGFAKDIGRRIFRTEDEAVDKIKELIESNNPGVSDLEVEFDNGIVSLGGVCDSTAAMQKCVLLAGNVKGVVDVYANKMTVKPQPQKAAAATAPGDTKTEAAAPAEEVEEKVEFYVIQSGDTLSKIAKRYYGDAMKYPRIFEANREVIQDPDKIFVGQKIRIPLD